MSKVMEETERIKSREIEEEEEEIWSWGAGTEGQLGTGKLQDEHKPQLIHSLSSFGPISHLSCGGAHVIALTPGGRVLTWGRGNSGQLGHGEMVNCLHPKSVESLEGAFITHASAGWNHSGFVSDTGYVFTCGDGSFGQLGHGDYISRCSPVQVLHFKARHVEQIACGMRHSLVLLKGDTEDLIYGFGSGKRGQLGISDDKQKSVSTPQVTLGFENVKIRSVTANGDHSTAISMNGHLYIWGRAFHGAPDVYTPRRVTADLLFSQVALGWNHALVLTGDGEVYMLGKYNYNVPTGAQKANGMKHISEDEGVMQRVLDFNSKKVVQIGAGAEHSAVVTADDGSVMTWGWGEHGQLGLGDTNDQTSPRVNCICMATNLQKRGLVSLGKRFLNQITYSTSRNSANSSSTAQISGRRVVHTSVYDKNPEEYVSSWVPDEIIEVESDKYKYWTPHPQTGVFGPATDHIIKYGEYGSQFSTVDSVLEQKTFFRDLEDLEKPSYP